MLQVMNGLVQACSRARGKIFVYISLCRAQYISLHGTNKSNVQGWVEIWVPVGAWQDCTRPVVEVELWWASCKGPLNDLLAPCLEACGRACSGSKPTHTTSNPTAFMAAA